MPKPTRQPRKGRPRFHLSYANVISTICLFVLLGGGAYAAARARLPRNAVGVRQIRKGAVTTAKLRNGAVTGPKLDLGSLGTVPSAARAESAASADSAASAKRATNAGHATNADHATSTDRATSASHADSADRATSAVQATSATHADSADRALAAGTAGDAERLGGRPASTYQLILQHTCPNAAIQAIGPDGSVSCREAVLPVMLNQSAGDPVSEAQLGPGLLLQSVCHDGGQVKVVFLNDGAVAASLNWFASVGGTVSADGAFIAANGSRSFLFDGGRIEGQFIYSIGVNVTTVSLHALDATASCEVRGTALLGAPPAR